MLAEQGGLHRDRTTDYILDDIWAVQRLQDILRRLKKPGIAMALKVANCPAVILTRWTGVYGVEFTPGF